MIRKRKFKSVIQKLRRIVGPQNVLTAAEELYCYSRDSSPFSAMPDIVVRPRDVRQVARIVKLANRSLIPITPRGAGTNLTGAAIPLRGGIVVDLSGMNRILEIDRTNLRTIVEPGVVHADLERELAKYRLFWPPDPASTDACTIGGVLAESGGGMRALKYGTARDWVLGLEVVLPNGKLIRTGSQTLKCASGFDLTRLFTRSEGMLGIIVKAVLKLRPLPESLIRITGTYDELESAGSTVGKIFEAGIVPTIMEILDKPTIEAVNKFLKLKLPEANALIILDIDGTEEECEKLAKKVEAVMVEMGAKNVRRAATAKEMEDLYSARKAAFPALCQLKPTILIEDITVPVSELSSMLKRIQELSRKYGVLIATLGHVGDGNLHPNICTDDSNPEEWRRAMKCFREICESAIELGGTISGEHGIGIAKAALLEKEYGREAVKVMRDIKRVLDPNNIMNPGKMGLGA